MKNTITTHEKRSVKGSLVTTKTGETHFRKSHKREMEVAVDQPVQSSSKKLLDSLFSNQLKDANITDMVNIQGDNVTENIKKLKMKDKNGKELFGYFKGVNNDPFISPKAKETYADMRKVSLDPAFLQGYKTFLRPGIRLNLRTNNRPLTFDEHLKAEDMADHGRDKYKGHMMDREIATAMLGKALGVEHLPDINVRKIKTDDAKDPQLGVVVNDVMKQFTRPDTKKIVKGATDPMGILLSSRTDPKIGDKAIFDYLIGNLDRHKDNYFLRTNGDGKVDMLLFDQGLSFPNNNKSMEIYQQKSVGAKHPGKNAPPSTDFVEKLGTLLESPELTELQEFMTDNIGQKEKVAFMDRLTHVVSSIFKENKKSMKDIIG